MKWDALELVAAILQTTPAQLAYYCGTADPVVIVAMVASDALTWASYMAIGGFFLAFILKAKVIGWSKNKVAFEIASLFDACLVVLTGLFVVSCGIGHLADVLVSAGKIDLATRSIFHVITAGISVASAAYLLWRGRHGR